MNNIPTEKLLPQGLQDILSAQRECKAQANDIHNEIIYRGMKILHLPLKAQRYEKIESGVQTEVYIEIKPYWVNRLAQCYKWCALNVLTHLDRCKQCHTDFNDIMTNGYTHVKLSYGYTKRTMMFKIESITIGKGKPEWGAPIEEVFIIKLGNTPSCCFYRR